MAQHVYTRLAGFRLTVIPYAPFHIKRVDAALNAMIYIQSPRELPTLEAMRTPNQKITHMERRGESGWIEMEYTHDGEPWCQRHEIVALSNRRMVVTMQAPIRFSEPAAIAAVEIAKSLAIPGNAR